MPSRRAVLGSVSASLSGVVAGCVGDIGGTTNETDRADEPSKTSEPSETDDSSPSRTRSPDGTATPYYAGECEAVEHDWVDPIRESVEPKSLPERPPAFESDAVASFVEEYERAFLYNSVLQEETESVGVSAGIESSESVPGGFVVTVDSVYYYNVRAVRTANGTATGVHADGPYTRKAYLVTEQRLVRAEGEYEQAPDPRTEGTTVECWGGD